MSVWMEQYDPYAHLYDEQSEPPLSPDELREIESEEEQERRADLGDYE